MEEAECNQRGESKILTVAYNTIASWDSPGLADIKTYAQKMQDAQVTKSLAIHVGSISDEVERESTPREKSNNIRLYLIKLCLRPVLLFF